MKIAIIFPKDSEALFNKESNRTFGGATVQMYLFAKELNNYEKTGIKTLSFIVDYEDIFLKEEGLFNLVKTYKEKDNNFLKCLKFIQIINKTRPDVVIQHGLTFFSCLLALFCNIFNIKFIFMFANDREVSGRFQSNNKKCSIYLMLLKNAKYLIVQNNFQINKIPKKYLPKTRIIKNGFEIKVINSSKENYVLWVARHDKIKRPELFLDLAKINSNINFVMICPKIESETEIEYNNFKDQAHKIANLEFIDMVQFDDIDKYFKKAKIFVNTSESEGSPQTFIQSAINGVPILSLNVNPDNFLSEFECGFECKNDLCLLSEKLKQLLSDEDLYLKLSKNIYQYGKKNHDIKNSVKLLLNFIGYE